MAEAPGFLSSRAPSLPFARSWHPRVLASHRWVSRSRGRKRVIGHATQPLTGKQLKKRTDISLKRCSEIVRQLKRHGSLKCLNPQANSSRLYWLTDLGRATQHILYRERGRPQPSHFVPQVDWTLYGRICYRHRSTVIRMLREPMQAATLKRKAYFRDPTIRMSSNNVRDVMRFLLKNKIVERLQSKGRSHPLYRLTPLGISYQHLLARSKERPWRE